MNREDKKRLQDLFEKKQDKGFGLGPEDQKAVDEIFNRHKIPEHLRSQLTGTLLTGISTTNYEDRLEQLISKQLNKIDYLERTKDIIRQDLQKQRIRKGLNK